MIVLELAVGDFSAGISLDLTVNEVLLISFLDPFHLSLEPLQIVLGEHFLPGNVVGGIINQSVYILVHLRWDEFHMWHPISVHVGQHVSWGVRWQKYLS